MEQTDSGGVGDLKDESDGWELTCAIVLCWPAANKEPT